MNLDKIHVLTFLFLFLVAGCSKENETDLPVPEPDPTPERPQADREINENMTLAKNTVLLTEEFIQHIANPVASMEITLDSSIKESDLPQKGQVLLYGAISEKFPSGFLGKVTAVDKIGDQYRIQTKSVTLDEAFDKLYINETQSFKFKEDVSDEAQSRTIGMYMQPYTHEDYNGIRFNQNIDFTGGLDHEWKLTHGSISSSLTGEIDTSYGIGLKLTCNIDIDKERDKKYVVITLHSHTFQDIIYALKGTVNATYERELVKIPLAANLYPKGKIIQIILQPNAILSFYLSFDGEFEMNHSQHDEQDWMLYFEHKDNETKTGIKDLKSGISHQNITSFLLKGAVGIGLKMEFSLKLFNMEEVSAKASVSAGPSITAELPIPQEKENYYDNFKDNTITLAFSGDTKMEFKVPLINANNNSSFSVGSHYDFFSKKYYFFPSFEEIHWDQSTLSVFSNVRRDLFVPTKLDYALFDKDHEFIKYLCKQPVEYKLEKDFHQPLKSERTEIEEEETYYVRPIIELPLLGKIKAMPEIKLEVIKVETVDAAYSNKILTMVGKFNPQVSNISSFGICYSTVNISPTLADNRIIALRHDDGEFQINLSGVNEGDTYYYRVYIIHDGKIYLAENVKKIKIKDNDNPLIVGKWKLVESKGTSTCDDPGYIEWPWGNLTINSDGTFHASEGYLPNINGTWYFISDSK